MGVVDVVHTDGNQWGTMRPLGDADFCDHSKSIKFYRESIQKKDIFKDILECEIDSELRVQGCRETERKPQFGYFYKHGQRRRRRESLLDVRKIQGRRPLKQQSKLQQPMSHRIQIMTSIEIIFKPTQKLIIMFTSEESLYQELT